MNIPILESQPIFIVGMNGSGTTMLLDCLDNHPNIFGFRRETRILPHFIQSAGKYGNLSNNANFLKMWDDFRTISFFRYVNDGQDVPLPENWRDAPRCVASVIDKTFGYFLEKEGKSRWCEKTPMHAQHICLLAETFPNAKFVHIIRDGRACAASFNRRWGFIPELTIYRWKRIVQSAQQQGQTIPTRYFELRYEDLTNDPEMWLQKICEFIKEPYDSRITTLSRVREFSGASGPTITKRSEYWRDYFTAQKQDALGLIAGKTLNSLGYKADYIDHEEDPALLRIKYWMYKDNIRQGILTIRNEVMRSKRGNKWDDFSSRIYHAIRQRLTNRI